MNENYKITFVILHYQNIDITKECVSYLLKLKDIDKHQIVIVDNASPNKTGEMLLKTYSHVPNITVVQSGTNGGFASGNNIGYQYAIHDLHADIVVVMNSDLFIYDSSFIQKLEISANENDNIAIIAPDIINARSLHQNPYMYHAYSNKKQYKIIVKKFIGKILYSMPLLNGILIRRKAVTDVAGGSKEKNQHVQEDIIPHGACVIFLPEYTKKENQAFVPGTFLFVEEEILYDFCKFKGYHIIYDPSLVVHHMEDGSQDYVYKNLLLKKKHQINFEIQSRILLLNKRKEYSLSKRGK
ncbi:glycosyltransferase family 2 protein [Bifidobacterium avesanii]|uniref:Glycosyltransferase n=1 Tax=Bifidobacterium avesanii TaxID=1798157 RepID=A0A7K3TLR1_9BIFI|nr:glycosyltransferase [Bifidobacterium avesanii]KAB8287936.1 glycosyl transferase family 2 [Bifidobacterium avesanii]NEG79203.1 glycosyltransferase [Bifidobacterium avesanii]